MRNNSKEMINDEALICFRTLLCSWGSVPVQLTFPMRAYGSLLFVTKNVSIHTTSCEKKSYIASYKRDYVDQLTTIFGHLDGVGKS